MTPPRLLTSLGMVDTGHAGGISIYQAPVLGSMSNEYAAMPSLHVGWALLIAVVLIAACRTPVALAVAAAPGRDGLRGGQHGQPLLARRRRRRGAVLGGVAGCTRAAPLAAPGMSNVDRAALLAGSIRLASGVSFLISPGEGEPVLGRQGGPGPDDRACCCGRWATATP